MQIDPSVERPTRDMVEHAIRGKLEEIVPLLEAFDDAQRRYFLELCVALAGYVAIDAAGMRWPRDEALAEIADLLAKAKLDVNLDRDDVYAYLARVVFGFEPLEQVFSELGKAMLWPIVITANLLFVFCPKNETVWQYMNKIEQAMESAASLERDVYPAVIYRARMPSTD